MKKFFNFSLAAMALIASFAACKKDDSVKTVSAEITVIEDFDTQSVPSPASYTVVMKNISTGQDFTAQTVNRIATFTQLMPGVYNVTVSASVTSGITLYNIAGAKENESVVADSEIQIKVTAAKESALVFKELYTGGVTVKTPAEAGDDYGVTYFRDQFYEVYNNSIETVYADGLCIAICDHYNYDFSMKFQFPAPYDYDNYVFVNTVWQVPGNGTDYPVKPGESIIFAQWATDHTAEKLSGGKSTVNLSGVEFEAILGESEVYGGITITDGPAINLKRAVLTGYAMPQWLTSVSGCGYILFKPEEPLRQENYLTPTNYEYSHHIEIPISCIIDAVERGADATRAETPQLPATLNAGMVYFSAPGSYTGESMVRKVAETRADGTVKYQNTRNASNDFEVAASPVIRRGGAKAPSWNTWAK